MKKKWFVLLTAVYLLMQSLFFSAPVSAENASYERLSGKNRYDTASAAVWKLYNLNNKTKFDYAVLASGKDFADALGGSYLACVKNAPVLITDDKHAEKVNTDIRNLVNQGGVIFVLGGTAAVSEEAVASLREDYSVIRLAGRNRYLTNIQILKEADVANEEIIVATGTDFADSLSASAAGKPILLVGKSLNADQKEYLSSINTEKFYIVGGTGAVSEDIEDELKRYGEVTRLSGKTRYETSILIAETFMPNADTAVLAYSHNFPDGLCGGPIAYKLGAPIILTQTGKERQAADYTVQHHINTGIILGGSSLIDDDTAEEIFPPADPALETYTHAVLTDEGDYIYFLSYENYPEGESQTVTDINGNTYYGRVSSHVNWNWREYADGAAGGTDNTITFWRQRIIRAYAAPGQSIVLEGIGLSQAVNMQSFDATGITVTDSLSGAFNSCKSLVHLDLSALDTSTVTDMCFMFSGCNSLAELDVSHFDTSQVTDMSYMFSGCSSLKNLDVSSFDTSNVESMYCMFSGCASLEELDVSSFDTSNVTDMGSLFSYCSSLKDLDISSFNTSSVEYFDFMFADCESLTDLDLHHFDTHKATWMRSMFENCSSLKNLDVSSFDTSHVAGMYGVFSGCSSLTDLDVSPFDTSSATSMSCLFESCSSLTSLNVSHFDTSNVTDFYRMFADCSSLTSLDLSNWDTSKVEDFGYMFQGCSSLEYLDIAHFDTGSQKGVLVDFLGNCDALQAIILSPKFLAWENSAGGSGLPSGYWKHGDLVMPSYELLEEYPSHASEWAGLWEWAYSY